MSALTLPVTARQLANVQAHPATGTMKGAASALGISESTVDGHLAAARARLGVETTEQVVAVLVSRGSLDVPMAGSAGQR